MNNRKEGSYLGYLKALRIKGAVASKLNNIGKGTGESPRDFSNRISVQWWYSCFLCTLEGKSSTTLLNVLVIIFP